MPIPTPTRTRVQLSAVDKHLHLNGKYMFEMFQVRRSCRYTRDFGARDDRLNIATVDLHPIHPLQWFGLVRGQGSVAAGPHLPWFGGKEWGASPHLQ